MRNLLLIAILTLIGSGVFLTETHAQVDVTVNPVGLMWGNIDLGVDFGLSPNVSIEGSVGYKSGSNSATNLKHRAVPVMAVGKYYFSPNRGSDRFYAGLFLRYVSRNYTANDGGSSFAEYTQKRVGAGIGAGYKVVSRGGLVFDIGVGVGRAFVDDTVFKTSGGTEEQIDWPSIMFTGKLGLGYRFGGK